MKLYQTLLKYLFLFGLQAQTTTWGFALSTMSGTRQTWTATTFSKKIPTAPLVLYRSKNSNDNKSNLEQNIGGYTVKQRLREEVESPFRTVRLYFFGFSTISALVAFYFSLLTLGKAFAGGFADALPVDEALTSVGINVMAILICGGITLRDFQAQQADLKRIKQGGALASLVVERFITDVKNDTAPTAPLGKERVTLSEFRRNSRVLICAGGKEYIETLCRSLNADQLDDENTLPQAIAAADLVVVPVLLDETSPSQQGNIIRVGDTSTCWMGTQVRNEQVDRNFDVERSLFVMAFPRGPLAWADVLAPEVETATKQGFDVLQKGITLILKKNGKILRRATGQPQWSGLLGTMEVLDGRKFGMPGDDEIYGTGKGSTPSA